MSPWVADCRTQAEPRLEQEGWGPSKGSVANSHGVSTSTLDCWAPNCSDQWKDWTGSLGPLTRSYQQRTTLCGQVHTWIKMGRWPDESQQEAMGRRESPRTQWREADDLLWNQGRCVQFNQWRCRVKIHWGLSDTPAPFIVSCQDSLAFTGNKVYIWNLACPVDVQVQLPRQPPSNPVSPSPVSRVHEVDCCGKEGEQSPD